MASAFCDKLTIENLCNSDVLKRYGVAVEDHAAIINELTPLMAGSGSKTLARAEKLDVTVVRGPEGGLGIDVDKSNIIIGSKGQKDLQVYTQTYVYIYNERARVGESERE